MAVFYLLPQTNMMFFWFSDALIFLITRLPYGGLFLIPSHSTSQMRSMLRMVEITTGVSYGFAWANGGLWGLQLLAWSLSIKSMKSDPWRYINETITLFLWWILLCGGALLASFEFICMRSVAASRRFSGRHPAPHDRSLFLIFYSLFVRAGFFYSIQKDEQKTHRSTLDGKVLAKFLYHFLQCCFIESNFFDWIAGFINEIVLLGKMFNQHTSADW